MTPKKEKKMYTGFRLPGDKKQTPPQLVKSPSADKAEPKVIVINPLVKPKS